MPLREIILRNSIKWTPCPCVLTAIRSEVAIQAEHWAFCFARNRHVYNTATRAESCSNLLGAARSYLELLESARGYTGLLGSKYSELVRCLELLGDTQGYLELVGTARSSSHCCTHQIKARYIFDRARMWAVQFIGRSRLIGPP